MNAELLGLLLHFLSNAPGADDALVVEVREAPDTVFVGDEALEGLDPVAPLPTFGNAYQLTAELEEALYDAARRAAVAQLASRLACMNRACRAAADAFASAEERAARAAQAQAMHDIAHALQCFVSSAWTRVVSFSVAPPLVVWCRVEDAATALDDLYDDDEDEENASPADKWREFAWEFAHAAEMPRRIWRARAMIGWYQTEHEEAMWFGHPAPQPLPNHEAVKELAEEEEEFFFKELVDLVQPPGSDSESDSE